MNKRGLLLQVHLFDKFKVIILFRIFKFGLDWRGSDMGPYLSIIFGVMNLEWQIVTAWQSIDIESALENDFRNANREIN